MKEHLTIRHNGERTFLYASDYPDELIAEVFGIVQQSRDERADLIVKAVNSMASRAPEERPK